MIDTSPARFLLRTLGRLAFRPPDRRPAARRDRHGRNPNPLRLESLEPRWLLTAQDLGAPQNLTRLAEFQQLAAGFLASERVVSPQGLTASAQVGPETLIPASAGDMVPFDRLKSARLSGNDPVSVITVRGQAPVFVTVPVDSTLAAINLDLEPMQAGVPLYASLHLLDESGRLIRSITPVEDDPRSALSMSLQMEGIAAPGHAIYIEVVPIPGLINKALSAFPGADAEMLRITRVFSPLSGNLPQKGADGLEATGSELGGKAGFGHVLSPLRESQPFSLGSITLDGLLVRVEAPSPVGIQTTFQARGTASDDALTELSKGLPVASGLPPLRSAAPMAGVLFMGDATPPVDVTDLARISLAAGLAALDDLDLSQTPQSASSPSDLGQEIAASRSLARGEHGLPLLATTLMANLADARQAAPVAMTMGDEHPIQSAPAEAACPVTSQDPPTDPGCSASSASGTRTSRRRLRTPPVYQGLAAALVMGLGPMLPDLVAAFQFFSPPPTKARGRRKRHQIKT